MGLASRQASLWKALDRSWDLLIIALISYNAPHGPCNDKGVAFKGYPRKN